MMVMMKAVNTIRIKKGRANEILARFRTPKSVHTFEGFVLMEVLIKENSPDYDELQVCTTWKDRKYFEKWLTSRAAQKVHHKDWEPTPDEKLAGRLVGKLANPEVELGEQFEEKSVGKLEGKKVEQPEDSPILSSELTTFEIAVQHKPEQQGA
ncbi:antibiotic biosynthesis monooxygenase [Paenibacillus fonticola]|uniref:antibiotic biosynthesis monooxygenase n=1 Tax=Paenibacillus fonticola TaxID=379896 RepID=UPI0003653E55|nr:antibiotic biosynthesis monooxygenase [Paenibacillus fonticola]